jgi:hypothetical protein
LADNLDPETLRDLNARMREMSDTLGKLVPGMIAMSAAVVYVMVKKLITSF